MPGPGRRREGAGARPAGADHHPDGGNLVLGLQDRELVLLRLRVAAVLPAERGERFHQRRRRRDRIPGADRRAGVDAAEPGGGVAVDQDGVLRLVHRLEPDRQRTGEVLARVVVAEVDRLPVRVHERRLARVLLGQQRPDDLGVHAEQRRERAGIRDVLHQDALARALELGVAHLGERNPEVGHVRPRQPLVERPRRVVEQPAAGPDLLDVLLVGRGVERDHQVEVRRPRRVAVLVDPDLVPGRQALDVRREHVLPGHRDAHAEDGLHDQAVGRRRPGAVGGGDLESEFVGSRHKVWLAQLSSQLLSCQLSDDHSDHNRAD